MTRTKRIILWGIVLSPVAIFPIGFIAARIWLNHHLQRELAFGEFHLRLTRPVLGWDLDFSADSVDIGAPRFGLTTGRVDAEVRIWNSVASLKPSVKVSTDTIRIAVEPDTTENGEDRRKRRRKPTFPNFRIPMDFQARAGLMELRSGGRLLASLREPSLRSEGPKGIAAEIASATFTLPPREDTVTKAAAAADTARVPSVDRSLELRAGARVSARWFGRWLRYQARAQDTAGDFLRWEGERRKSDLRVGKDSIEAGLADLSALAALFRRPPPDFRAISLKASFSTDGEKTSLHAGAGFTTPMVWVIAPQSAEWTLDMEDSTGRMTLAAHGPAGEEAWLQGRFGLPSMDIGGIKALLPRVTADFSGYTRNLRFRIGRRMLPGDAEIRHLRLLPGMELDADVRSRDSSVVRGRVFRVQDTSRTAGRNDSAWRIEFRGTAAPREAWAHAWTDTNLAWKAARVEGTVDRLGLHVEAWVKQPRAYGAAADSLWASQTINRAGFYLTDSRVHGKEAVWPVTGEVEWGRRQAGKVIPKRKVSLEFRTQHARYGSAVYTMADPGEMSVRVENLEAQKLPYVRIPRVTALAPVVTGTFAWDMEARAGTIDAGAAFSYAGHALEVEANAKWDALHFAAQGLDVTLGGSRVHLAGSARLEGRQFWQMGKLGLKDIRSVSLEARRFDASKLGPFVGEGFPVERAFLDGRLAYTDTTGFSGKYRIEDLDLGPIRKLIAIPRLSLEGRGENLLLTVRTSSTAYPWLNDSLRVEVQGVLGNVPGLLVDAVSDDGLRVSFRGTSRDFRDVDGVFSVTGKAALPGQAGDIRDVRLGGHFMTPFTKGLLTEMVLDSGTFAGRYALPGLDTQAFSGTMSLREGRLRIPDLRAANSEGTTLSGSAECEIAGAPKVTANLRGQNLALRWPGIQKLMLREADASLRVDTGGLSAIARVGRAEFASNRPPISTRGSLEDLTLEYIQPPPAKSAAGPKALPPVPTLKVKARMRDFLFKHKIGFRELQKSIGKVKVDKRKKRVKPVDLQINLETAGAGNRVETDILRMAFAGDLSVRGVYPYTLLTGEFSSLSGELGQTSQSYDIADFDLKWQNATVEEGRISVEGRKRLRATCRPDENRNCNVYVKLAGRLDEMAFTYDSDCGGNTGENLEPSALINSVSRGCWSEEYVAGAGGGNYSEAVFALLEPTINEKLTSVGDRFTGGWIKRTSVSGIGTAVSGDTTGNEPIAIGVETKEKWGVSVKAKAGYHPEKKEENIWESKVAAEWRPPLEKASKNSEWKKAVRDRVTLEASAETRPEEKVKEENQEARLQVGLRYRYKFWNLW